MGYLCFSSLELYLSLYSRRNAIQRRGVLSHFIILLSSGAGIIQWVGQGGCINNNSFCHIIFFSFPDTVAAGYFVLSSGAGIVGQSEVPASTTVFSFSFSRFIPKTPLFLCLRKNSFMCCRRGRRTALQCSDETRSSPNSIFFFFCLQCLRPPMNGEVFALFFPFSFRINY